MQKSNQWFKINQNATVAFSTDEGIDSISICL